MKLITNKTTIILTEDEANALLKAREVFDAIFEACEYNDPIEDYAKDAKNEIESFLDNCDIQVEKKQATKTTLVAIVDLD